MAEKHFEAYSWVEIQKSLTYEFPPCIISINWEIDPPDLSNVTWSFRHVLVLRFPDTNDRSDPNAFSEKQADQILDFFFENDACVNWKAHCLAGMSRSAGVMAALALIAGEKEQEQKFFRSKTPNSMVYRTILERAVDRGLWSPI